MAKFTGNLNDFLRYVGPLSRNIVSDLSRKHKKHKTCAVDGCNKRKPLEAAHKKGFERPIIIANILDSYLISEDYYEVDLKEFEEKFREAHTPISDVIQPMCKEHHLEYDKKNQINQEYPIILDEFTNDEGIDVYLIDELMELEEKEKIEVNKALKNKDFIFNHLYKLKQRNLDLENIKIFSNKEKCNELFDLNYPLLRNFNENDENNRRYYSKKYFVDSNNNKYQVTNHWFPQQRQCFNKWIEKNL